LPENAVQVEDYARHYPDPEQRVDLWARHFVETAPARTPLGILSAMTRAIQSQFTYNPRDEMGTGNLGHKNRDLPRFALLLMEAARSLGFAARFVSGYLYDDRKIRGGPETVIGGGVTHAWTQVYLRCRPGAIRSQKGSFIGRPTDFLGMDVSVEVRAGKGHEAGLSVACCRTKQIGSRFGRRSPSAVA
jgi:hypothetical protein